MKTLMQKYIILLMVSVVSGCGPVKKDEEVVLVPKEEKVNIPAYLLVKCPPIKKIPVRSYNQGETVEIVNRVIDQSEECRKKDDILVDTVKKAFNTEQQKPASK